ncbi:hypothetical protein MG293_017543, partial [Ovis ammon polii]
ILAYLLDLLFVVMIKILSLIVHQLDYQVLDVRSDTQLVFNRGKELHLVLPGILRNLTDAVFLCSFVPCQVMQNTLACKIRASIVSKMLCAFVSGVDLEVVKLAKTKPGPLQIWLLMSLRNLKSFPFCDKGQDSNQIQLMFSAFPLVIWIHEMARQRMVY